MKYCTILHDKLLKELEKHNNFYVVNEYFGSSYLKIRINALNSILTYTIVKWELNGDYITFSIPDDADFLIEDNVGGQICVLRLYNELGKVPHSWNEFNTYRLSNDEEYDIILDKINNLEKSIKKAIIRIKIKNINKDFE